MSIIQKLPDNISNKISAGEVVQRPSSAVKELLENAIDAKATEIIFVIKDAGKLLLQVIDNGIGMNEEDAVMCFERFATSKLKAVEDLDSLRTLGFRGEALSSIASVGQVELKTKRRDDAVGTKVDIENDEMQTSKVQCADGTNISVRNLFYNVPARRKFLKTNSTEYKHIYETLQALTLIHSDILWKFVVDGKTIFHFTTTNIFERFDYFFGDGFSKSLFPVKEVNDALTIEGWLGKPGMSKKIKNEQFLYVNGRITQNKTLSFMISQGYGELLGEREYPFFFLNISIAPNKIDINIHPSKMEVKFEDERNVYNMIRAVIGKHVSKMEYAPSIKLVSNDYDVRNETFSNQPPSIHRNNFSSSTYEKKMSYEEREKTIQTTRDLFKEYKTFTPVEEKKMESIDLHSQVPMFKKENAIRESYNTSSERFVWQMHNKYILTQIKSGLMIIDQHVAHERILYERAIAIMKSGVSNSQQLLFPQRIMLKPWELEIVNKLKSHLEMLGFSFREFGQNVIVIEGIPPDVKPGKEEKILQEMIEQYDEYQKKSFLDDLDAIAKSYSCRNAIMAGDPLSLKEMNLLIDQLFATAMPYVCPHGRPIIIKISLEEFDKMFGRT